jgi:GH18 family chitinase
MKSWTKLSFLLILCISSVTWARSAMATPLPVVPGTAVIEYFTLYDPSAMTDISQIPWSDISELVVAFAGIDSSGDCNWVNDINSGSVGTTITNSPNPNIISAITAARNTNNPNVAVVLSVGGQAASFRFSDAVSTATNANNLANSCVSLINTLGIDGIDYDWEYPTHYNGGTCPTGIGITHCDRTADSNNFVTLLQYTRAALNARAPMGVNAPLTAAVGTNTSYYNVPGMDEYLTT